MQVLEVVFNSTGFRKTEKKELADVIRENPSDALDIVRTIEEGKRYTVKDGKGWGFSVARA